MPKQKVCIVTGAGGTVGQHLVANLVTNGYKVVALGEAIDSFTPDILQNRHIKITTALPVSAEMLKSYDVQFCFGDISDISFLASVFNAADIGNIEIELVFYLSAHKLIQKEAPAAYHPNFGASANVLEVALAYWQSHKQTFKGFFYAAENGNRTTKQVEKLIKKIQARETFPAVIYQAEALSNIAGGYKGRTSLSSLYRFISPVKTPVIPTVISWKTEADSELSYIAGLKRATDKIISQIKADRPISLD